jgi:hypothetical protein
LVWEIEIGGQTIRATAEHPFWREGDGWTAVNRLLAGDRVLSESGDWAVVGAIRALNDWITVYNVRVGDCHTYFVGDRDDGSAVWVHNAYKVSNYLRSKGIKLAWKAEQLLVQQTGAGTRNWSNAEKAELLSKGKVAGYIGHHINSVKESPLLAWISDNIEFVRRGADHLQKHNGNYRNGTRGHLIDRSI